MRVIKNLYGKKFVDFIYNNIFNRVIIMIHIIHLAFPKMSWTTGILCAVWSTRFKTQKLFNGLFLLLLLFRGFTGFDCLGY